MVVSVAWHLRAYELLGPISRVEELWYGSDDVAMVDRQCPPNILTRFTGCYQNNEEDLRLIRPMS